MMATLERHILGISGGRDSAALAVHMRQTRPELPLEYFFTDTGKELAEVYSFLDKLEGFLGRPIARINPDRDFGRVGARANSSYGRSSNGSRQTWKQASKCIPMLPSALMNQVAMAIRRPIPICPCISP